MMMMGHHAARRTELPLARHVLYKTLYDVFRSPSGLLQPQVKTPGTAAILGYRSMHPRHLPCASYMVHS